MQYSEIFFSFHQKMFDDSKYRLWVHVTPRRGGSNEYPQSMFWTKNKKNRHTPANLSVTVEKWGIRGYTFYGSVFLMCVRVAILLL